MPITIDGTGTITGATTLASTVASPTFTTPALGTPASGILTSCTGYAAANLPAGSVIQVVSTHKGSTFSGTSVLDNGGYFVDVTGLSASITPTSSSSTILILTTLYAGNSNMYQFSYRIKRTIGATTTFPILGTTEGGRPISTGHVGSYSTYNIDSTYGTVNAGGNHRDSPNTTLAITYQVQLGSYSSVPIVYVNRSYAFQASANDFETIPVSTIILMEIAG